ncbi:MAG: hypothetical protein ABJA66_11680, partial [Actinomycetota bacterium]
TSYLATDGSFQVDGASGGIMRREREDRNMIMKTPMSTGQGAVRASKDAKEKSEATTLADDETINIQTERTVKKVGVKTFYLENGVWIDSEFKEEAKKSETKLQFASNEYFDLITKEKELAQFFSLGEQVVVVWKGKVYRITK